MASVLTPAAVPKPTPTPRQRADPVPAEGPASTEKPPQAAGRTPPQQQQQQQASPATKIRTLRLRDHVGFDSLPDQIVSKAVSQGFSFNILCVGETGIGKSTLIETLFNSSFGSTPGDHEAEGVRLQSSTHRLKESNVDLKLTVVDSVGFGDQVNKDQSWSPIVDFIDTKFEDFLQEELKIQRNLSTFDDSRIHVCLYFISPTGHSLRSLDLLTMKHLDSRVNVIPVIGKADIVSKTELKTFKARIKAELLNNNVQVYQFPTDDEEVAGANSKMNSEIPFAVIGSNETMVVNNKKVKVRQYPWGTIQIENEDHCDFVKLREMLVRTNMEDLREKTHDLHYETYRRRRLLDMGLGDEAKDEDGQPSNLCQTFEKKRAEHLEHLQSKEDEMRQLFVQRVKSKEAELKESEKELHVKFEKLKRVHAEEKKNLEERKRLFEEEYQTFLQRRDVDRASALLRSQQGGVGQTMDPHLATNSGVHASASSLSVGKSFSSTLKRFTSNKNVEKSSPELHH